MGIECVEFKEYKSGCLEGFAKIYVQKWDLEISGCKVFSKGNQRWFSLPSKEYQDENKETKWAPLLFIRDKEVSKKFGEAALSSIDSWRAQNPVQEPQQQPQRVTAPEDSGGLPF